MVEQGWCAEFETYCQRCSKDYKEEQRIMDELKDLKISVAGTGYV